MKRVSPTEIIYYPKEQKYKLDPKRLVPAPEIFEGSKPYIEEESEKKE